MLTPKATKPVVINRGNAIGKQVQNFTVQQAQHANEQA